MPRMHTTKSIDVPNTSVWSRVAIAAAAVCWVALSSTLCGCGVASGYALNESGRTYFRAGNYTAATAAFSRATLDNPSNPDYAYNLAKAMHKGGQLTAAEHQYRRALAIDPRHQPSYNGLASLMHETGREGEATALISTWASTQPHLPAAHIELAAIQRKQGQFDAAEQSLRTALRTDPTNTVALAHMGELMQQKGDPNQAASYYRQSLAKNPFQSQVGSRLAAISQPPAPVVRQASYAPAPEMIAGRQNPSFVPPAATHRPAVPIAAPPYTPVAWTASPFIANQNPRAVSGTPYRIGPANYLRTQGAMFTPGMTPPGQPVASYTTPGLGSQPTTMGGPISTGTQITYQMPTGANGFAGTPASPVLSGTPAVVSYQQPQATPLSTQVATPAPLPAPSLVAPSGIAPASYSPAGAAGGVQPAMYTSEPAPLAAPVVPAF